MSGTRYTIFRSDSIEREATLKFSKHRQYQAVLIASLAGTAAGTLDGWMMMSVDATTGRTEYGSMVVYHFISYMFAIVGAITFGFISDHIGRKAALILIGLVMLPVWVLYMLANAWTVAAGLVLSGLAAGGATVAVPLYISDIADKSSRAILIVLFYQLFIAGELVTFFGNPKERLASTASFAFLIALIFVLTFVWMPESPYHLLSVGREVDARRSVEFFSGDWDLVDTQIALIKESNKNRKSMLAHIKDKSLRTPLLITAGLTILSRLVAVDSFNYRLIKRHFYHHNTVHGDNEAIKFGFGVNLALQLIVMGICGFLIEKYGRRKMLYISSFGISISAVPLMFAPFLSGFEIILLPLLFLYIGAFSAGLATIPWILAGDLFAPEHKTVSFTVNAVLFWGIASFASERLILAIRYFYNFFGVYFLLLTIALVLYIKSVIPETKDSNPSEIRTEIDSLISRFRTKPTATTPPVSC
ncbi:sugar transporter ERD6-like 8 [Nilaparvata lugens]|uniref:Sugar transporter n=1 Tax=Nilaparvata lugens TaxID=108931 RepID=A0A0A8J7Y1_NILLU|nr:sugar transporter ERD6-like 8 [Nilaparvata lugens]XP_039300461.1 sugar transporter ERD6-like 8 [Nilaparvata lugens]BAQ02357.1 sugar transporter [Nilaparvata lugens]